MQKVDIQDTREFWNVEERIATDTGRLPENYDPAKDVFVDQVERFVSPNSRYSATIPDDAKILEIGCGGGRMLMLWECNRQRYGHHFQLEGLDHASNAVELAKTRVPTAKFHIMGAEDMPFEEEYDMIYSQTALQHNSAWKQRLIFPRIYAALKPKGIFWMISEMTFSRWEHQEIIDPFYCDTRGSHGTAAWWIQRIANFGFELVWYERREYGWQKI